MLPQMARSGCWYRNPTRNRISRRHLMWNRPDHHHLRGGPLLALGSAFLFGASTPIAKLLLGITEPLLLAGLLYLGSGVGLALVTAVGRSLGVVRPEAPLRARDVPLACRDRIVRRHARSGSPDVGSHALARLERRSPA